jgi:WhiB family redox-sensing transcriptional regulator
MDGVTTMAGKLPWGTSVPRAWVGYSLLALSRRRRWTERALCRDHGEPEWWYPERSSVNRAAGGLTLPEKRAKAICVTCPVREACLREALEMRDPWGIWGGTLPWERERVAHRHDCEPGTRARPRDHGACRPVDEQVEILLEWMDDQASRWGLMGQEVVA